MIINPNVKYAETKLRRLLSSQVKIIPDGKGTGGKLEIEYYGDDDLDRIYQIITNIYRLKESMGKKRLTEMVSSAG